MRIQVWERERHPHTGVEEREDTGVCERETGVREKEREGVGERER